MNGLLNRFGIYFRITFMLYWNVFGYFWRSAPRQHQSIVSEVLALCFLMVFSFSCYLHDMFGLVLLSIPGSILACFGIDVWRFWELESFQNVIKKSMR